jgi:lysozyme family protein
MTDRFTAFMPFILKWETEYNKDGSARTEHDPDDPGGTTKYGIDQRSHPGVDIENLTKDGALQIYFSEWTEEGCEDMAPKLGEVYFNACVNAGTGRADKLMAESNGVAAAFLDAQASFYRRLADQRPRMAKYMKGWLNRVNDLRKFLDLDS